MSRKKVPLTAGEMRDAAVAALDKLIFGVAHQDNDPLPILSGSMRVAYIVAAQYIKDIKLEKEINENTSTGS